MGKPIVEVNRIVVFLHPGQLSVGNIYPVTFVDCNPGFEEQIKNFSLEGAICLYDGPPQ